MIPGFNTDIEHDGITYHVQTEDKGVKSPIILSLVYHGGTILASKRTPYDDLLMTGLNEAILAERLQRQHKLICAAIRNGRIEDLKRMNERGKEGSISFPDKSKQSLPSSEPVADTDGSPGDVTADLLDLGLPAQATAGKTVPGRDEAVSRRATVRIIKEGVADFARQPAAADALSLSLLEESEIHGGCDVSLKVKLTQDGGLPLAATTVNAKILGTAFSQVDCETQTNADGIAVLNLSIPAFASGRAVLLISAIANGHEATLRRIVQPS